MSVRGQVILGAKRFNPVQHPGRPGYKNNLVARIREWENMNALDQRGTRRPGSQKR